MAVATKAQPIRSLLKIGLPFIAVCIAAGSFCTRQSEKQASAYFIQQDWRAQLVIDSIYRFDYKSYGALRCRMLSTNKRLVVTDLSQPFGFIIGAKEAVIISTSLDTYKVGDTLLLDSPNEELAIIRNNQSLPPRHLTFIDRDWDGLSQDGCHESIVEQLKAHYLTSLYLN